MYGTDEISITSLTSDRLLSALIVSPSDYSAPSIGSLFLPLMSDLVYVASVCVTDTGMLLITTALLLMTPSHDTWRRQQHMYSRYLVSEITHGLHATLD